MPMQTYIQLGIEGGSMHNTVSQSPRLSFKIFTYPAGKEILPFDAEKHEYLVDLPSPVAEMKLRVVTVMLGESPESTVGFVHAKLHPIDDMGKRRYFSVMSVAEEVIGELCICVKEPTREARAWASQYPQDDLVDTRGFYTPQPMRRQRGLEHANREEKFLASRKKAWQRQAIRATVK